MPKPKRYRPNVAAIVQSAEGLLLIGQRSDYPESWQFPQGGIEEGESAEEALRREVLEEVALAPEAYHIEKKRGLYRYDFPKGPDRRGCWGQEQTYFLCRLQRDEIPALNLGQTSGEFAALRWVPLAGFPVHLVPPMKQAVYREVLRDFFKAETH